MQIVDLTVEYRKAPMGLDTIPRFSWKMESRYKNTLQQGYQILVKSDEKKIWDSGRVESRQSLFVEYQGEELSPCTIYTVEVRVWDNHGERGVARGKFETGLLSQDHWQAEWITHSLPPEEEACPVFLRKFHTEKKRILLARAYAACRGVYELEVNGRKAGDAFLAPGWTSYHNRIQYQIYDITKLLLEGKEEEAETIFKITVGNGWYKGYLNGEGRNCFYGDRTAVLAMFRIVYEDGSVQVIGTDTEWKVTTGIIRASELYHGETQDFSFEMLPEMQADRAVLWKKAEGSPQTTACRPEPGSVTAERHSEPGSVTAERHSESGRTAEEHSQPVCITAQQSEPVRITKRLSARRKILTPRGELVLDFGQNLAGFVEVKLPELQGEALRIFHAETLDKEGNFYTENLRTARSTDTYIYTEREVGRVVHPHFTYHGFRYIRLEGVGQNVDMECFTACALHTDMEQTGYFSCDYEPVSRLQKNIEWTQRSNFVDIPTDCPQRDERLGWTGDAQIFCRTAMYQFNTALFYKKWLRDLALESDDEQGIPQMVPNFMGASRGTSVWGDSAVIIPWTLYQVYGDEAVLREQYPNMRSWIDYISRACGENTLWMDGFQRGDWLGLDGDGSLHSLSGGTDRNLVANAYYAYSCRILRDAAGVLKLQKDAVKYGALYDRIAEELNREYVTPNGRLVSETQTACVLLLHFQLIKEEYRDRVIGILEENLNRHHGHLTTGFVGTAYLCHVLTDNGLHKLAENILLTEDYPGWLYAVKKGATTVWERWNSILPDGDFDASGMNSLNHYAYGAVGDWLYRRVAGIDLLESGYRKILIKPHLTKGLSEVKASYHSMYGEIFIHLRCRDGWITVDVAIPANTTAVLELPERSELINVGSGSWHYEYPTDINLKLEAYSLNTTFARILESEKSAAILEEYLPGTAGSQMLGFIRGKTLNEMIAMAPQQRERIEAMLAKLNE